MPESWLFQRSCWFPDSQELCSFCNILFMTNSEITQVLCCKTIEKSLSVNSLNKSALKRKRTLGPQGQECPFEGTGPLTEDPGLSAYSWSQSVKRFHETQKWWVFTAQWRLNTRGCKSRWKLDAVADTLCVFPGNIWSWSWSCQSESCLGDFCCVWYIRSLIVTHRLVSFFTDTLNLKGRSWNLVWTFRWIGATLHPWSSQSPQRFLSFTPFHRWLRPPKGNKAFEIDFAWC